MEDILYLSGHDDFVLVQHRGRVPESGVVGPDDHHVDLDARVHRRAPLAATTPSVVCNINAET